MIVGRELEKSDFQVIKEHTISPSPKKVTFKLYRVFLMDVNYIRAVSKLACSSPRNCVRPQPSRSHQVIAGPVTTGSNPWMLERPLNPSVRRGKSSNFGGFR